MQTKKQPPYNDSISIWILMIVFTALIMSFSSCATYKKDCRGVRHEKQKGGFYL